MAGRLMLLDTASLYFRAFYGVPESVKAPDGMPVNGIRGLLDIVAKLVGDYEPTALVACWDDDWRPRWRVELVPSYKQHRVERAVPGGVDVEETPPGLVPQIPVIRELLGILGIAVVGAEQAEADDVIGCLARRATSPVDVVTGDGEPYSYLVESIRKFPDQRNFAAMIERAGFGRVSFRNYSGGIAALHSGWKL